MLVVGITSGLLPIAADRRFPAMAAKGHERPSPAGNQEDQRQVIK